MRIIKLRFENINSLRGTHEVDFGGEAFRHSNLFAIVGPTGAGKTTLLDVITLTLYNRIPRLGKISPELLANTGAVISRGTNRAATEVTFQCGEGVFCAKWTIEKTLVKRGDRKGEFDWREALELSKEDGAILSSKKGDVLELVRAKVGLDYEQFVKAILLSQGDFAAFLKANPRDRSDLLERITGTEIYRSLGARAFAKWNYEKKKEIEDARTAIQHVTLLSEEEIEAKTNRWAEVKTNLTETILQKDIADKALASKQLRIEKRTELTRLQQKEKPELTLRLQEFDKNQAVRLRRHEALLAVAQPLADHGALVQQTANEQTRQLTFQEGQKKAVENRNTLLRQLEKLLGEAVDEAEAASQLTDFQEEINQLYTTCQTTEISVNSVRKQVQQQLSKLAESAVTTAWQKGTDSALNALREYWKGLKAEQSSIRQQEMVADSDDLKNLTEATEQRKTDLQDLIGHVNGYQQLARQISHEGELGGFQQQIKGEEKAALELKEPRKQALANVAARQNASNEAVQRKYSFLTQSALPRLRSALREGEPCEVCGSTHHPARHRLGPQLEKAEAYLNSLNALDEEISELGIAEEVAQKQAQQVENKILLTNERMNELQRRLAEAQHQQQEIQNLIAPLKVRLGLERIGKADEVRSWLADTDQRLMALRRLSLIENSLVLAKELADALNAFITEQKNAESAQSALKARYQGEPNRLPVVVGDYLQKLARRDYQPEAFAEELKTTTEKLAAMFLDQRKLEEKLLPELSNLGFSTTEMARQGLLPKNEVERLSREETELKDEEKKLVARERVLIDELNALPDDVTVDLPTLEAQVFDLKAKETSLNREEIGLQFTLEQNAKNKLELAEKQARVHKLQAESRKWALLSDVLGDRLGDRFNRFAQRLTLAHLVRSANHHLRDLSERYRLLSPVGEEEDLWILDLNFDERRAVATLSGGETFLVSLALALALSDLVSQNVRLESLFIDEGFGTLDPETLEVALGTLEKLQGQSGKMIGIISHVEALKERITTQIRLKKHPGGFSELSVV